MGFALVFLWFLIPITTFAVSLLIGLNNYWKEWKWFLPILFGIMHMLAGYATFSMKNMVAISFERINMPEFEMILVGALISYFGIGIGTLFSYAKSKLLKGKASKM